MQPKLTTIPTRSSATTASTASAHSAHPSANGSSPHPPNGSALHARRVLPRGEIGYRSQADFIESMYETWKTNPQSLEPDWRSFFEGFELGIQLPPSLEEISPHPSGKPVSAERAPADAQHALLQARIHQLIDTYRTQGHQKANLDPLGLNTPSASSCSLFEPRQFGLAAVNESVRFDCDGLLPSKEGSLSEITAALETTYCQSIGVECMHMSDAAPRLWLQEKMESCRNQPAYSKEKKARILQKLQEAELFERFLHTRFVGQKRFSLEGGDALIPMLDAVIEAAPAAGIEEMIVGMAHRGRLNVLVNTLGKPCADILDEFSEHFVPKITRGDGDVKYHMGYESQVSTSRKQKVRMKLAANPSHLESVNPVVEGMARARQMMQGKEGAEKSVRPLEEFADDEAISRQQQSASPECINILEGRNASCNAESVHQMQLCMRSILPILIHGDAAFIGQGIVAETLNFSQLEGYNTGGTLHIVINNQIGFTTPPSEGRSATYCTALAKAIEAPIFHINGDDPLAAVYITELATQFRQKFAQDIVIDLVCYRKHGHNEGDEPSFTQPLLYQTIHAHPSVVDIFGRAMVESGEIAEADAEAYSKQYTEKLTAALTESKARMEKAGHAAVRMREPICTPELLEPVKSAVSKAALEKIGRTLSEEPAGEGGFKLNPKIATLLKNRRAMIDGQEPIDWGFGEALAFGTLVADGYSVRVSGQDCRRGTFSHRHAVLYDTEHHHRRYIPLEQLAAKGASFCIYNSPLSEEAILGFEFGYSLEQSKGLVIWEAQFGDFVNGAQNIIDQYISSSESKWGIACGLVLLLPHGYHGQGPEHSSARLERFLQSCAEDNMVVANCTTPASYFHLLRRQALFKTRKPLVVMTPKGLLRDKRATSSVADFSQGKFEEILSDPAAPKDATRVILCSGKVYYDLVDYRTQHAAAEKTAILRLEQLYPLHETKLKEAVGAFTKAKTWVWCQEESQNMGAWNYIEPRLRKLFGGKGKECMEWVYAGRDESASPATGSHAIHEAEQQELVASAFNN